MYLLKPDTAHETAVQTFVSKCEEEQDSHSDIFGGEVLALAMNQGGYNGWLEQVQRNEEAHSVRPDAEPGYTFLLVEAIHSPTDVLMSYKEQFPILPNGDFLVGVVTLRSAVNGELAEAMLGTLACGHTALMTLTLLPAFRNTANYMLAVQDILAHIICMGLPYKWIRALVPADGKSQQYDQALGKCNFVSHSLMSKSGSHVVQVDLRAAHQLRSRIQEYREEG